MSFSIVVLLRSYESYLYAGLCYGVRHLVSGGVAVTFSEGSLRF